jgi:hypothetical protein
MSPVVVVAFGANALLQLPVWVLCSLADCHEFDKN